MSILAIKIWNLKIWKSEMLKILKIDFSKSIFFQHIIFFKIVFFFFKIENLSTYFFKKKSFFFFKIEKISFFLLFFFKIEKNQNIAIEKSRTFSETFSTYFVFKIKKFQKIFCFSKSKNLINIFFFQNHYKIEHFSKNEEKNENLKCWKCSRFFEILYFYCFYCITPYLRHAPQCTLFFYVCCLSR